MEKVKTEMFEKPVYLEYNGAIAELKSPYSFTSIKIEDGDCVWIDREGENKNVFKKYWQRLYNEGKAKVVTREKYDELKRKAKRLLFGKETTKPTFDTPIYLEYDGLVAELTTPYDFIGIRIEEGGCVWLEGEFMEEKENRIMAQSYLYRLYKKDKAKVVSRERYEEIKRKAKQLVFGE